MGKPCTRNSHYGIDAPGLVQGFLLGGLAFGVTGFFLSRWSGLHPWAAWIAGLLLLAAAYCVGLFASMLWGSLITKVRGRESILDLIRWTGSEQVLDVGCGRGLLLVGAAHRLTSGRAVGIDLWQEQDQTGNKRSAPLENARSEGVAERVSVETGDMRALPFQDQAFDVVVSSWAVHNLEQRKDRRQALAEMVRVMRPEGAILLTDIANRKEYAEELKRLGMTYVRVVAESKPRDMFNALISFGSFCPATIVATKEQQTLL